MKLRKVMASERMIHGTIAQPPTIAANRTPRRMLKYLGEREVAPVQELEPSRATVMIKIYDSLPFPKDTELALTLTQICADISQSRS